MSWSEMPSRSQLLKTFRLLRHTHVLHVMHNDKFNGPYIELIQKHFAQRNHAFIFYGGSPESEFKIPAYDNVIVLRNKTQLGFLGLFLLLAKKVFFHGLLIHELVHYLSKRTASLRKACWIIWGADLYPDQAVKDSNYFRAKKLVVQHLGAIAAVATGDLRIARNLYDFKGRGYYALYKNPIEMDWLNPFQHPQKQSEIITIQINNNADESVLDLLDQLARFKALPVRIRVILSYGNPAIKSTILAKGKTLFEDKFQPVTDYLSPQQYAGLICDCDVLIMNQRRQQGLGNIYAFLYHGGKVYVRSDVTTWSFLRHLGFAVFDTLKLDSETFEDLCRFSPEDRRNNHLLARPLFDDNHVAGLWRELFDGTAPDHTAEN